MYQIDKKKCNNPSSPLIDIVRFGPLCIVVSLTVLKCVLLRRGFHTVIRNASLPSPTDVGSHNPPPFGPNVLADTLPGVWLWYHLWQPKSSTSKYCPLWPVTYHCQPHGFKTRLLRKGFHTHIRNVSFPFPTDVGSHNPPPLGPSILAGTPLSVWL